MRLARQRAQDLFRYRLNGTCATLIPPYHGHTVLVLGLSRLYRTARMSITGCGGSGGRR